MTVWTANIEALAKANPNFLAVVYMSEHSEITVMCIGPGDDVGTEVGRRVDQLIRIEQGTARLTLGKSAKVVDATHELGEGSVVMIPEGVWHNITNVGAGDLKISSFYTPPIHPEGLVHKTKEEWLAEKLEIARVASEAGAFGA